MLRVTFSAKALGREFVNVEDHETLGSARLRASALGWFIVKAEMHTPSGLVEIERDELRSRLSRFILD